MVFVFLLSLRLAKMLLPLVLFLLPVSILVCFSVIQLPTGIYICSSNNLFRIFIFARKTSKEDLNHKCYNNRMRKVKNKGFSLVEVVIVLAISAGLIVIALSVFSQRRRVASDDAVEQIASSVQTVRNEAQNGFGPADDTGFNHNDTLYGEAIRFSNGADCNNNLPCMIVYKLKASKNGANTVFSSYENYQIPNPNGVEYYNAVEPAPGSCSNNAVLLSCFTAKDGIASVVDSRDYFLLIKNGSGAMYYYRSGNGICNIGQPGVSCLAPESFGPFSNPPTQGKLRQALLYRQNGSITSTAVTDTDQPGATDYQYYLSIDMLGGGSITTSRP